MSKEQAWLISSSVNFVSVSFILLNILYIFQIKSLFYIKRYFISSYVLHFLSSKLIFHLIPDIFPSAPNHLSMKFSRQGYWSRLPFLSPGDLLDPGIKPGSPTFQACSLPSEPLGKPFFHQLHSDLISYSHYIWIGNQIPYPSLPSRNAICVAFFVILHWIMNIQRPGH